MTTLPLTTPTFTTPPFTTRTVRLLARLTALICAAAACAGQALAAPEVKLADPQWTFWQSNLPVVSRELKLTSAEQAALRELRPLLEAEDYAAARAQLNSRPVAEASGALNLLRGQILLQVKDYAAARTAFEAVLQVAPEAARAHRGLAMAHLATDRRDLAADHLAQALALGDADAETYAQLAYLNLRNDNAFAAVAGYQQALFLRPDNLQWQQALTFALTKSGQYGAATALIDAQLEKSPNDAQTWLQRAQVALQQGRPQAALASLEAAERLGDRDPQNRLLAAQLHLQHGSAQRAVDLLAANLAELKNLQGDTLTTLTQAGAWLAAKEQWRTLDALATAATANPAIRGDAAVALAVPRARAMVAKERLSDARAALFNSLQADPTQGEALLLLGEIVHRQGDAPRALLYYQRAQALPEFRLRALLAQAQLEIDREAFAAALALLRDALRTDPGRDDLRANIQALEHLLRHGQA